jgi:hypothetical protein
MEAQFKNTDWSVTGDICLLKAFSDKLESLGFVLYYPTKYCYIAPNSNISREPILKSHLIPHVLKAKNFVYSDNKSAVEFTLPNQWDEALKYIVSEPKEDKPQLEIPSQRVELFIKGGAIEVHENVVGLSFKKG